jgi:hypothetical protein
MRRFITGRRSRSLFGALPAVAAALMLMASPAAAAWGPDIHVSTYIHGDSLNLNNGLVVASGGYLHFLYGNDDGVIYRRTTMDPSFGSSEKVMNIYGVLGDGEGIAANADGSLLVMLYRTYFTSPRKLIIQTSANSGSTWSSPVTVGSYAGSFTMGMASVAVSGQTVLVAWTDHRNGHVNFRRSIDGGAHFGSTVRLGTTTANELDEGQIDGQVKLAASGSRVVASWFAGHSSSWFGKKLVMRRSFDAGATFAASQTLDAGAQGFYGPSIAMAGTQLLVIHSTKTGHVRELRSVNGGQSFSSIDISGTKLTNERTDIAADSAHPLEVRAVWFHGGRIYLRRSHDGGKTWAALEDTLARADPYGAVQPNVVVTSAETVVAWDATTPYDDVTGVSRYIDARVGS